MLECYSAFNSPKNLITEYSLTSLNLLSYEDSSCSVLLYSTFYKLLRRIFQWSQMEEVGIKAERGSFKWKQDLIRRNASFGQILVWRQENG